MRQSSMSQAYRPSREFLTLCVESWMLVAMCMADALSTLLLVSIGLATEYNPIMDWCLRRGPLLFLLVKCLTFVPFVAAVEVYRRSDPAKGQALGRLAVAAYAFVYVVLVVLVNLRLV